MEVKYTVTSQVLTIDTFEIVVIAQPYYQIDLVRFSIVAFDK